MALTKTDAIDAALESGELAVQYQDKRVTYRSVEELKAARALIDGEMNPQKSPRVRRYATRAGWDGS